MLLKNPTILGSLLLGILSIGYFIYAFSGLVFGSSKTVADTSAQTSNTSVSQSPDSVPQTGGQNAPALSTGGDGHQASSVSPAPSHRIDTIKQMLGLYDLQTLYYTGHTTRQSQTKGFQFFVTLEAKTPEGTYYLDDAFLRANDIAYVHYDDCLLKLTKENITINVTCKPILREAVPDASQPPQVKLGALF